MKNLKVKSILFSLLAMMAVAVFLTSCERESIVEDDVLGWRTSSLYLIEDELDGFPIESSIDEELTKWIDIAKKQNVVVEHATLEEINKLMVEHGLEPFSQKDLEDAVKSSPIWPCIAWNFLGDWNGDGSLSGLDLLRAAQYLCDFPNVGCSGNLHISSNNFPTEEAFKFRYMSYLGYGYGAGILGQDDIDVALERILGIIVCR